MQHSWASVFKSLLWQGSSSVSVTLAGAHLNSTSWTRHSWSNILDAWKYTYTQYACYYHTENQVLIRDIMTTSSECTHRIRPLAWTNGRIPLSMNWLDLLECAFHVTIIIQEEQFLFHWIRTLNEDPSSRNAHSQYWACNLSLSKQRFPSEVSSQNYSFST